MPDAAILVVDDDADIRDICAEALDAGGFQVFTAGSADEALSLVDAGNVEILLTDLKMPGLSGMELLRHIKERELPTDVILMTGHATVDSAVEALRFGAYDYITKPFSVEELTSRVARLAERKELRSENALLREQLETGRGPGGMVGSSPRMQELYRLILRLAPRTQPVLILGESGTGKELVARAIHECGPNARLPFVAIDCGALSTTLLESELFGHVPGAFTGAVQKRVGLLASAGKGTVFFDEIGELPLEVQAKLLRAIQEREYRLLGSNATQRFEARILAATNRNLETAVKEGKFRKDLYFRLNVLSVRTPPLRERREDIPALVASFIENESGPLCPVTGISRQATQMLMNCAWTGNVRELRNHVERALAMSEGPLIQAQDLAPEIRAAAPAARPAGPPAGKLEVAERQAILEALESTGGHRVEAAKLLGMGKTTLYRKLKEYELSAYVR